ncbi:MAG: hypothetical protein ACI9ON_003276, partial [Limisphaerales bacterium]
NQDGRVSVSAAEIVAILVSTFLGDRLGAVCGKPSRQKPEWLAS